MEMLYAVSALIALVLCASLGWITRPKQDADVGAPEGFQKFQTTYLVAWAVCVLADWLQGPYVYALYESYGISHQDNARLFVMGFGASFIFGTFVAGFADTFGRKRTILLYCALYTASCLTKHVNHYPVLALGRITGGIATSILFSVFESWLVSEHSTRHNFPSKLLGYNFSLMYFVNYLVAVTSGMTSQYFVDAVTMNPVIGNIYFGGLLMPFDMAILAMVIGGVYVALNWEENYGERSGTAMEEIKKFAQCTVMVCTNLKMAFLCLIVALFESSMFIFVFNWTPVLEKGVTVPHGVVFSTFMMFCMSGASIFSLCNGIDNNKMLLAALCLGAAAQLMPGVVGITGELAPFNFWAFLFFEAAVGIYFPSICTLKSQVVPEGQRSTIYNLFRAPMNAIVCTVLLLNPSIPATFMLIFQMLAMAAVLMGILLVVQQREEGKAETAPLTASAALKV